eukprot:jgi/Galph1/5984/GphlegSOOS_G4544.1
MVVWGSVSSFIQRHRRKLVLAGFLGAAFYGIYRLNKAYKSLQTQLESNSSRKDTYSIQKKFRTCQKTTVFTVCSFLPRLKSRLWELIELETIVGQLRKNTGVSEEKKRELWEQLKIQSFVRFLCSVYSMPLLYLFITLKVSLLGRYLTEELKVSLKVHDHSEHIGSDELDSLFQELQNFRTAQSIDRRTQQAYLQVTAEFLQRFLELLEGLVKDAVERELLNVSVEEFVDSSFIGAVLAHIREHVEGEAIFELPGLIAESEIQAVENRGFQTRLSVEDSLLSLLNETADIMDSGDFSDVLREVIDIVFENVNIQMFSVFSTLHQEKNKIPLAQFLPKLAAFTSPMFLDSPSNNYVSLMSELDCVENFAVSVFLSGEKQTPTEDIVQ